MSMVLTERRGSVTILTLNNPEQYNALGGSLLGELNEALDAALSEPAVRAIMLTGAGRGFCSGAQFGGNTFNAGEQIGATMRNSLNPLLEKMRSSPKPIVVAVNGAAAGAGVGIALAGDIVIAARSARFILSFVRLGAALDAGTSLFLQRSIGVARARALALLGQPLGAEQAEQWGLIWKMVEDADLLSEAIAIAQGLADGPPVSIGLIKSQIEGAWSA
jgi:2-(1,2-epoxy-1,2-dihydrophenyl)acetyl-CoA isomerase